MSGVLDTFYILFKSNAAEAEKGAKQATEAGKELEHGLGRMDAVAVQAGEHIIETFKEVGATLLGVFAAERLFEFTKEVVELNAQLGITAERLGIDVEELYAWQQATERAGGSADGFNSTLDYLNRGMADIATKGTSRLKPFFDELKISVTDAAHKVRPLTTILGELADKFSKMDAQQRAGIGEKLGIDQGTLLLLAQGRRAVEDIVNQEKALGAVTKEDTEIAHAFHIQMHDLGDAFHAVATAVASTILPGLSKVVGYITEFVQFLSTHKGLVEGFFVGVGTVIATTLLPAVIKAVVWVGALAVEFLAVPLAIAAVIAAFAFLYDDIQNFLAGNNSIIGELSKKWPIIGETVREVAKDIGAAFEWAKGFFGNFIQFIASGVNLLYTLFQKFGEGVRDRFTGVSEGLAKAFPFWAKVFKEIGGLIEWLIGLVGKLVGWFAKFSIGTIAALPKALGNWAKDLDKGAVALGGTTPGQKVAAASGAIAGVVAARDKIAAANASPLNAERPAAGAVVNKHITVNAPVTVNAKTDASADDIAGAVHGHIGDQVRQAVGHFDDGVKS